MTVKTLSLSLFSEVLYVNNHFVYKGLGVVFVAREMARLFHECLCVHASLRLRGSRE